MPQRTTHVAGEGDQAGSPRQLHLCAVAVVAGPAVTAPGGAACATFSARLKRSAVVALRRRPHARAAREPSHCPPPGATARRAARHGAPLVTASREGRAGWAGQGRAQGCRRRAGRQWPGPRPCHGGRVPSPQPPVPSPQRGALVVGGVSQAPGPPPPALQRSLHEIGGGVAAAGMPERTPGCQPRRRSRTQHTTSGFRAFLSFFLQLLGAHACFFISLCLLFASVGQASAAPESALGWIGVTLLSLSLSIQWNMTMYQHLISQAGWNRCNLSIYLEARFSERSGGPLVTPSYECRYRVCSCLRAMSLTICFLVPGVCGVHATLFFSPMQCT